MLVWIRAVLYGLIVLVAGAAIIVGVYGPERGFRIIDDVTSTKVGGPFAMIDHTGKAVTDADYRGKYMLVFFGFTNCPDICPTELQTISAALDLFPPATLERVQPLFVTVDDERDTPAAIKEYLGAFHPRFVGLTGSSAQVAAITKVYRAYALKGPANRDGMFMIEHAGFIYLMSPEGAFVDIFRPGQQPNDLAKKLKRKIV
ncbi:MAG: SCO family protein [Alphaproteobacteria bacterium]|nr:SCO family protein [Alphaproteobacteria bacterium]